jgi:hypothetical protein
MAQRADTLDSTAASALSPQGDCIPPTSSTAPAPIDRCALMQRAHLLARRFREVMPSYRAALAYGLRVAWNDAKARAEHRERFAGYVPRPMTAKQIADSRAVTRRCGASYMPF